MPSSFKPSKLVRFVILVSPIFLAACGEGWEMVRVTDFPYGNKRTAGTGVAYVRAKMLPEKELKLESAPAAPALMTPAPASPPPVVTPPSKAEEVFREQQSK